MPVVKFERSIACGTMPGQATIQSDRANPPLIGRGLYPHRPCSARGSPGISAPPTGALGSSAPVLCSNGLAAVDTSLQPAAMIAHGLDSLEPTLAAIAAFAGAVAGDHERRNAVAVRLAHTSGIEQRSVARLLTLWPRGFDPDAWSRRIAELRGQNAVPRGPVALIAAGNMPVATWTATMELLALGVSLRIRPASGDPDAAPALVDWLAQVAPSLATRIDIVPCPRDDAAGWRRLVHGCSAIVVFGGDAATDAVAALARSLGFAGPVRSHGDKLSLGWLDLDVFDQLDDRARAAWLDDVLEAALLADGRGCLSLRALLVPGPSERAGEIARMLAARADAIAATFPAGELALDRVAARSHALEDDRLDAAMSGGLRR